LLLFKRAVRKRNLWSRRVKTIHYLKKTYLHCGVHGSVVSKFNMW
jgi:hypothetical protein